MVLGNYYCLFWCNVSVKECTWETTVRAREVKWGHQKGKTNHTGLEWNWTKNKWVSFFTPSLKIQADENKLGVFWLLVVQSTNFVNFWDFEYCSL